MKGFDPGLKARQVTEMRATAHACWLAVDQKPDPELGIRAATGDGVRRAP